MSVRKGQTGDPAGITMHRFKVVVPKVPGQADEDRKAMMGEIQAEIERHGRDASPEAMRAAVEEIARRYGATIGSFEEH